MKKLVVVTMLILMTLSVYAAGRAEAVQDEVTLTFGIQMTSDTSYSKAAVMLSELVAERTDGKFKIEVFTDAALGSESEMWESIQMGTLDMVMIAPGVIGNYVPEYQLYELPFLFQDRAHRDLVATTDIGIRLDEILEEKGDMIVLSQFGGTGRNLLTRTRKVETLSDLEGLKMRVYPSPIVVRTWEDLKTVPIVVAYAEVYTALQTGVADAAENEMSSFVTQRWYEPSRYITMTEHNINLRPVIIGKASYEKLSAEYQNILREAALEAAVYAVQQERDDEVAQINQIKEFGVEYVQLKDKDKWIEATSALRADFARQYGLEEVLAEIEAAAK